MERCSELSDSDKMMFECARRGDEKGLEEALKTADVFAVNEYHLTARRVVELDGWCPDIAEILRKAEDKAGSSKPKSKGSVRRGKGCTKA